MEPGGPQPETDSDHSSFREKVREDGDDDSAFDDDDPIPPGGGDPLPPAPPPPGSPPPDMDSSVCGLVAWDYATSHRSICRGPFGCGRRIASGAPRFALIFRPRKPRAYLHAECTTAQDIGRSAFFYQSYKFLSDCEMDPAAPEFVKTLKDSLEDYAIEHSLPGFGGEGSAAGGSAG